MIPDWMKQTDAYVPPQDGGTFAVKTIRALGGAMSRIRIQRGHEKKYALPALLKVILLVAALLFLSVSQNRIVLLAYAAVWQAYLCTWPAEDILPIWKASAVGACLSVLLFFPAMLLNPGGIPNDLAVVAKVFLSVEMVSIFNHTTQWNHITAALRRLHIPGIFIFTLDITLKYIVLLGTLIQELLTALLLRSVGRNDRAYQSIGGVMGVTFLRGSEMSTEMYEAMRCRCYTDEMM